MRRMKRNTRWDIPIKSGHSPPLSISRFVTNGLICGKPPAAPWKSVYHCLSYTWFLGMISVGWTIMMAMYLPRQMHSAREYRDHVVAYLQLPTQGRASKFQQTRDCKSWGTTGRKRRNSIRLAVAFYSSRTEIANFHWPLRVDLCDQLCISLQNPST